MRRYIISIFIMMMTLSFSVDLNAQDRDGRHRHRRPGHHHRHPGDRQPVGAPIDGGLLTILGAAGVAYYVARKKKS